MAAIISGFILFWVGVSIGRMYQIQKMFGISLLDRFRKKQDEF